jgi:hypothetical protein
LGIGMHNHTSYSYKECNMVIKKIQYGERSSHKELSENKDTS